MTDSPALPSHPFDDAFARELFARLAQVLADAFRSSIVTAGAQSSGVNAEETFRRYVESALPAADFVRNAVEYSRQELGVTEALSVEDRERMLDEAIAALNAGELRDHIDRVVTDPELAV